MRSLLVFSSLLVVFDASAVDCHFGINLKDFHKNPKQFLDAPLLKLDSNCNKVQSKVLFSADQIASGEYVIIKDSDRKKRCHVSDDGTSQICLNEIAPGQNVIAGRAPIQSVDRAENLVTGNMLLDKLEDIHELGLTKGKVATQPWSDWYWPIAVGQLSYRYADRKMVNSYNRSNLEPEGVWPWFRDYNQQNPATSVNVDDLSPSEKYDILMGDANYTLTKAMLNAGKSYQDQYGKVEQWMGLCHGWAVASYMMDRPAKTISVKAADKKTDIQFRPSDLKALGTLLWSTGQSQTKFVGGRCNKKNPKKDKESGRILDQECFDNNPASWHMAVVTELGFHKKPFVIDATFDYEVWNHPVVSYRYKYFNPKTMEEYDSIIDAKISMSEFDNDKFSKFRAKNATSIVGIKMRLEYMVETMPSTDATDSASEDASHHVQYIYDLELDKNDKIIGGEWYSNKHPDFMWTPHEGSKASSILDPYLPDLSLDQITHPEILKYIPEVSNQSQPVGKVIEVLFKEASR
jgi:hypothetical protein